MVLDGKLSQEYAVNARVIQGSILVPTLFLLYINDRLDDVICHIANYTDDTTLYSRCDKASDLWEQLELTSGAIDVKMDWSVLDENHLLKCWA